MRPLIPSLLIRGAATNPSGTLAGGAFGGGINGRMGDFSARGDWDIQVLWELQNLGFGNLAKVRERRAENEAAIIDLFRVQDRIAAEVADAYAKAKSAEGRITHAENGIKDAILSLNEHFKGLEQPVGKLQAPVIRPQEVVAAIQAVSRAYNNYYIAVADYDRAQFRLYRALGQPAQSLSGVSDCLPTTSRPHRR
jgi:outer membrane protein TolC